MLSGRDMLVLPTCLSLASHHPALLFPVDYTPQSRGLSNLRVSTSALALTTDPRKEGSR
jgi:hypothetical protein